MSKIYTFALSFVFSFLLLSSSCFELDIGQTINYSQTENQIDVRKVKKFPNLYTHKFQKPTILKEIYNKGKKLYFDSLLTKDEPLVSASVLWLYNDPCVVHLNLANSLVVLLKDNRSFLTVQAIFSDKTNSNLENRAHIPSEAQVDLDISPTPKEPRNSQITVSNLELPDPRLNRFNLKYYSLSSNKLGTLKYNNDGLKTVTSITTQSTTRNEKPLEIPSKEEVYGVSVYYYEAFPLMLEVLYSYNKRAYFGYTPEEKWHRVYFPSFNDPSYPDFLYRRLSYYGCVNKYKWTIDISLKPETNDHYSINNFCISSAGVKTIENRSSIGFYTDSVNKNYRCFEHKPEDNRKFYADHLMNGSSIVQLEDTPAVTDLIRVYHHLDYKPYVIAFVTPSKKLHIYKYQEKTWIPHETVEFQNIDERFNNIRLLLDDLVLDDTGKRACPHLNIKDEYLRQLDEKVRILDSEYYDRRIPTIKRDKITTLYNSSYDVWWYNSSDTDSFVTYSGDLNSRLWVETQTNCALNHVKYYSYTIFEPKQGILVHGIQYHYDPNTYDMTVSLYTNALYVYTFRKNYYDYSDLPWRFISIKPIKVLQNFNVYKDYYLKVNNDNNLKVDISEAVQNPIDLLAYIPSVRVHASRALINTIYYDLKNYSYLHIYEYDHGARGYGNLNSSYAIIPSFFTVETTQNQAINHVKFRGQTIKDFRGSNILVHFIEFFYTDDYETTVYIYTNTLYVYVYSKEGNYYSQEPWVFKYKVPMDFTNNKTFEKYFTLTRNLSDFNFPTNYYVYLFRLLIDNFIKSIHLCESEFE